MEIQARTVPVFYVSRLLGLAPYIIKSNGKVRFDEIKLSVWLCFYSILVLLTSGR